MTRFPVFIMHSLIVSFITARIHFLPSVLSFFPCYFCCHIQCWVCLNLKDSLEKHHQLSFVNICYTFVLPMCRDQALHIHYCNNIRKNGTSLHNRHISKKLLDDICLFMFLDVLVCTNNIVSYF